MKEEIQIDHKHGCLWIWMKGYEKPLVYCFNPKNPKHQDIDQHYSKLLNIQKIVEITF